MGTYQPKCVQVVSETLNIKPQPNVTPRKQALTATCNRYSQQERGWVKQTSLHLFQHDHPFTMIIHIILLSPFIRVAGVFALLLNCFLLHFWQWIANDCEEKMNYWFIIQTNWKPSRGKIGHILCKKAKETKIWHRRGDWWLMVEFIFSNSWPGINQKLRQKLKCLRSCPTAVFELNEGNKNIIQVSTLPSQSPTQWRQQVVLLLPRTCICSDVEMELELRLFMRINALSLCSSCFCHQHSLPD